jgi:hypothetical protein
MERPVEDLRKYMTLSLALVALFLILTNAKNFSTVLSSAGDVWAKQLRTLQGVA